VSRRRRSESDESFAAAMRDATPLEDRKKIRTPPAEQIEALRDLLQALELEVIAKAGEEGKLFGSVTSAHVADLLAEKGFEIDRRKIALREHIKEVGEHAVPVRLRGDLVAELRLKVSAEE